MKINNRVDAYDVEAARAAISSSEMFIENVEEVYISDSAYSGFMIFLLTFLPKAKVKSPLDLGREFARVGLYGDEPSDVCVDVYFPEAEGEDGMLLWRNPRAPQQ